MEDIILTFVLATLIALPALGRQTVPTYSTLSASGTTTATVYFATSPSQQTLVVSAFATSDSAAGNLKFYTGGASATISATNSAGTTVSVATTNGFAAGDMVILETAAGLRTNGVIASLSARTNIVFTQNVFATLPGDQIYDAGQSPTILKVGAASVTYTADLLYAGNRGRPVMVKVNGTNACSLDAITARYE